ncbi:MAG TPA: M48 family peptidase [Sulfuricurvum sp.]|nr:M48 family peptidase [Sulfuricurvum sp.]
MFRSIIILLFLLWLGGCARTPVTDRTQMILIGNDQEMAMGLSEAEKIKRSEKLLPAGDPRVKRVRKIGERIAAVSGRDDFAWEFNVIESDQLNAFCLPGGKVFFYTGILKIMDNDDQLATVMGHEIAHALARHGAERLSMQMVSQTGGQLLGVALGVPAEYQALYTEAYGVGTSVGVLLPFSRKHESEADQIGVYLMWKAGVDPNQAVVFWRKMQIQSDAAPQYFQHCPVYRTILSESHGLAG